MAERPPNGNGLLPTGWLYLFRISEFFFDKVRIGKLGLNFEMRVKDSTDTVG